MNRSEIIKRIMAAVGPLIQAWLAKWLDDLLKRTAARLDPPGPSAATEAGELLDAARRQLWVWQFAKRRLLAQLAADVPLAVAAGRPLTSAEGAAIRILAADCG